MIHDPRKLSEEDLATIKFALTQAGHGQAAEELTGHIAALEDELTRTHQYYEEYLIPGMEGRSVGAWSDRVVGPRSIADWTRKLNEPPKSL
ncbi:hypothetical protein BH10PLA2_BH10PLA2_34850 [soil metagenome]